MSSSIYKRMVENLGQQHQLGIVMEELAELIQACSKERRGDTSNINEEIAHVEIMLEQLKHMDFYDQDEVDKQHNLAVVRLEEILCQHYQATL